MKLPLLTHDKETQQERSNAVLRIILLYDDICFILNHDQAIQLSSSNREQSHSCIKFLTEPFHLFSVV